MRTIKFRGRIVNEDIHNGGKLIYGALAIYAGCKHHTYWIYPQDSEQSQPADYAEPVDAETIEQLIALDKNGNEVYEGDRVYCPDGGYYVNAVGTWAEDNGKPFPASFDWYKEIRDGYVVLYEEVG